MATIINISSVTDYSGETPIITNSNPVTTIINQPVLPPVFTRIFYRLPCACCAYCNCCNCCGCCLNCWCGE